MSVTLQFDSDVGLLHRSISFTGFSSVTGQRWSSSLHNSLRSKAKRGYKSPRMNLFSSRVRGATWPLQLYQVDRFFQLLCNGLKDLLEVHKSEMDFILSQHTKTKTDSRMAFLYDLEKEKRTLERHIRRLEFQLSKVEELYEMYCLQWRLCQGVVNMKRAFSLSPSTRASRGSLLELNHNHRQSLQDISDMERELEILLGELHVKVKGLSGFARLCPGDQYEVAVHLDRQQWRTRGKIISDDTQFWDEEDMVFLPRIHNNFEIKVTEVKGLGSLLVGIVTCVTADFIVAKSQLMSVDITELGTIKLQLEVTWNPFDSSEKHLSVGRQSAASTKSYRRTAVRTPAFTEKCFIDSSDLQSYSSPDLPTPTALIPSSPVPTVMPGSVLSRDQPIKLGELIGELEKLLHNQCRSEKELRALDHHVLHLATIFKNGLSLMGSSSSEEVMCVEEVLESFDFLSQDFNTDEDTSCLGSLRLKNSGTSFQRGHLANNTHSSVNELPVAPLTSGNWGLDRTLEVHLDICCILLQMMTLTDFKPSRRELLEEMALQAEVLQRLSHLLLKKSNISASDLLPKAHRTREVLLFWEECVTDSSSPFFCHADSLRRTLRKLYAHKVKAKRPGQTERVFSRILQQLQMVCQMVPNLRPVNSPERVTLFQLSIYLKRWCVQELGAHISCLSKEEYILSTLKSPKRRQCLNKMNSRLIAELLPLGCTLQTLAALQIDSNQKVSKAAANCLCRAANSKDFKNKAVIYYTESLRSTDIQIQQGSCLALKHLKAEESVDHIADMWKSADEDVRGAVRETVLSFGEKGQLAFQRMEQLYIDMEEAAYQNQETELTIL